MTCMGMDEAGGAKGVTQIQLGESDSAAHAHVPWLIHYRCNRDRSEEALAIAVQPGLTVFTLWISSHVCTS